MRIGDFGVVVFVLLLHARRASRPLFHERINDASEVEVARGGDPHLDVIDALLDKRSQARCD